MNLHRSAQNQHGSSLLASYRPQHPNYRWFVVGMLWFVGFFNYADRQAVFVVLPLLQRDLHLSLAELGLLGSSFAWVYGLCAPFAGWVVDRVRRKGAILAGLEAWSCICAGTAWVQGLGAFVAARAAMGLAESFYFPGSLSMISDYHPPASRSRALGVHQTSVYAGTVLGGFFAGWIASRYSWRTAFVFFGLAGFILGLAMIRLLREPVRERPSSPAQAADQGLAGFLRLTLRTPAIWLLMLAFACANFVAVVLLAWMPAYLYSAYHLSLAMAGLTAGALTQIGSIAGTLCGGWLADSLQRRRCNGRILVQAAGVFCGAPFVLLSGWTAVPALMVGALIVWGVCKGLYDANIFASLFDLIPAGARGSATGCMNTVGWLFGGGLAPVLTGFLAERWGLGRSIGISSLAYVAAGAFLLLAGRRMPAKSAQAAILA